MFKLNKIIKYNLSHINNLKMKFLISLLTIVFLNQKLNGFQIFLKEENFHNMKQEVSSYYQCEDEYVIPNMDLNYTCNYIATLKNNINGTLLKYINNNSLSMHMLTNYTEFINSTDYIYRQDSYWNNAYLFEIKHSFLNYSTNNFNIDSLMYNTMDPYRKYYLIYDQNYSSLFNKKNEDYCSHYKLTNNYNNKLNIVIKDSYRNDFRNERYYNASNQEEKFNFSNFNFQFTYPYNSTAYNTLKANVLKSYNRYNIFDNINHSVYQIKNLNLNFYNYCKNTSLEYLEITLLYKDIPFFSFNQLCNNKNTTSKDYRIFASQVIFFFIITWIVYISTSQPIIIKENENDKSPTNNNYNNQSIISKICRIFSLDNSNFDFKLIFGMFIISSFLLIALYYVEDFINFFYGILVLSLSFFYLIILLLDIDKSSNYIVENLMLNIIESIFCHKYILIIRYVNHSKINSLNVNSNKYAEINKEENDISNNKMVEEVDSNVPNLFSHKINRKYLFRKKLNDLNNVTTKENEIEDTNRDTNTDNLNKNKNDDKILCTSIISFFKTVFSLRIKIIKDSDLSKTNDNEMKISYSLIIFSFISLISLIVYFHTRNFILNFIFAISITYSGVSSFPIFESYKMIYLFLLLFCLFDVFWVFFSPYVFGKNVMILAVQKLDYPIKISFPMIFKTIGNNCISIGLGDLIIPSCVIIYMKKIAFVLEKRSIYYFSIFFYFLTLCIVGFFNIMYQYPQPAIMYFFSVFNHMIIIYMYLIGNLKDLFNPNSKIDKILDKYKKNPDLRKIIEISYFDFFFKSGSKNNVKI